MSPIIEVQRLTKRFSRHTALCDVSLKVPPGCVFALLGENGAGKTTLIRTLLGLETPTSGTASVLGHDSRRDGEVIRREVGYLPERPMLYEWMTAAEIGWFTGGFYGDGFETNYRNMLNGFRVPSDRKLAKMSKGMKSKVALSLAMAHSPALLILDEPTSGLDTLVRREFLESMIDVAADGRTVLLSSHQISEVERVADWVAIVREGQLLDVSPLDQLKASIREWTITMQGTASAIPACPGRILSQVRDGHQWKLLVRDEALASDWTERLLSIDGVVAVDLRTPSLEEIFVAYMRLDNRGLGGQPTDAITDKIYA